MMAPSWEAYVHFANKHQQCGPLQCEPCTCQAFASYRLHQRPPRPELTGSRLRRPFPRSLLFILPTRSLRNSQAPHTCRKAKSTEGSPSFPQPPRLHPDSLSCCSVPLVGRRSLRSRVTSDGVARLVHLARRLVLKHRPDEVDRTRATIHVQVRFSFFQRLP